MRFTEKFSTSRLLFWFRELSRKEKLFIALSILEGVNRISLGLFHRPIPLGNWLDFVFVSLAFFLGIVYLRRILHRLLWRLRNRLIVTYILIGVVPIALIAAMLAISTYLLLGQVATYLVTTELKQHNDLLRGTAYSLGWQISDHIKSGSAETAAFSYLEDIHKRLPDFQAVVRTSLSTFSVPIDAGMHQFPDWSKPGFQGFLFSGREFAIAAHVQSGVEERRVEVFAYEPADEDLLSSLLPESARIQFRDLGGHDKLLASGGRGTPQSFHLGHVVFPGAGESAARRFHSLPQGWWDFTVSWGTPIEVRLPDGTQQSKGFLLGVESRPSLIIRQLFASLGDIAGTLKLVLLGITGLLLVVEGASLVIGVRLTRSITHAVAQLYEATLKVKTGDFSHQIPIRSTDQLSELASSFNRMTLDIQRLIVESKEKERLQSELEIAREVQAQLFPKKLPALKTLELRGVCNPARVVSGDYYDCVKIDPSHTAITIGDIAGKGISAALLMASIQASLRAQLALRKGYEPELTKRAGLSTAKLVSMLNRQLYESTTPEKFASFYCGVYNEVDGGLYYTNAGHLPPILIRDGQASRLSVSGMVIGAFPDVSYEEHTIQLCPGDLLVAFTDGVTEPENEYGEEFGEARLIELLLSDGNKPLDELIHVITTAVNEWQSSAELMDDMTLLLARRL